MKVSRRNLLKAIAGLTCAPAVMALAKHEKGSTGLDHLEGKTVDVLSGTATEARMREFEFSTTKVYRLDTSALSEFSKDVFAVYDRKRRK